MLKKLIGLSLCFLAAFASLAQAQTPSKDDGREADRAAIRAHIESICQAFIDGDIDKIYSTHTEDWRGFLEGSRVPIKGIDEYMRANGIPWPQPANTAKSAPRQNPASGFKVFDFDVQFYGPELAVACFNVDFGQKSGSEMTTLNRYRIMDVYAKRNGRWIQAASHTVIDPAWRAERQSQPANLPQQVRQQILTAREAVWRAFFTNDQAELDKLVPADTIVLEGSAEKPFVRKAEIMESAKQLAQSGSKLVRLEFPQTEIQVYGNTAILYTTYLYELENKGERHTSTGRATEIFVWRNGTWVNPGWHMSPFK
ncbi:MAG: nuclear transport factor 2 family protein [Acidobacteria bacterium]|nr:nuclear transport factor 2 family protein [Acidobacteriota bacterium]